MLLPDNINPKYSIYYNGGVILSALFDSADRKPIEIIDLFGKVKQINNMTFPIFILSLDWLYLINAAKIDSEGGVHLCS